MLKSVILTLYLMRSAVPCADLAMVHVQALNAAGLCRLLGGLAWVGILTFGVVSEQVKTRLEQAQEEKGGKVTGGWAARRQASVPSCLNALPGSAAWQQVDLLWEPQSRD